MHGTVIVATSAFSFALMTITAKYVQAQGVSTFALLFLRFFFSSIFMYIYLKLKNTAVSNNLESSKKYLLMGAVFYILLSICFFNSLTLIPAGLTSMLLFTYPVFVFITTLILKQESYSHRKFFALTVSLSGVLLTTGITGGNLIFDPLGILFGILSGFFFALYVVVTGFLVKKLHPFVASLYIFILSSMGFAIIVIIKSPLIFPSSLELWLLSMMVAGFSTMGLVLMAKGVELIGATKTSIISMLEPLTVTILGLILYKEYISSLTLLGGILIISGIIILKFQRTNATGILKQIEE